MLTRRKTAMRPRHPGRRWRGLGFGFAGEDGDAGGGGEVIRPDPGRWGVAQDPGDAGAGPYHDPEQAEYEAAVRREEIRVRNMGSPEEIEEYFRDSAIDLAAQGAETLGEGNCFGAMYQWGQAERFAGYAFGVAVANEWGVRGGFHDPEDDVEDSRFDVARSEIEGLLEAIEEYCAEDGFEGEGE